MRVCQRAQVWLCVHRVVRACAGAANAQRSGPAARPCFMRARPPAEFRIPFALLRQPVAAPCGESLLDYSAAVR
jgi:hypothetical protein